MDSLNLDTIATVLEALAQVAGKSNIQWASIAAIVLTAAGTILHKIRASKTPVAQLEAKDIEVVKAVDEKKVLTFEDILDKTLPPK